MPVTQLGRRVERRGDERLLHEPQLGAHRRAEPDAEPVVVRRGEREQLRAELWGQLLDHRRRCRRSRRRRSRPPLRGSRRARRTCARRRRRPRRHPRDLPATTRLVAPVSYRTSTSVSAIRSASASSTILAPPVSPGLGTLCPRGAGLAMSRNGCTFSLPVNISPWVPGWITAFSW